jgi:ribonucleoside-diphosphate reductase alpha chain
LETFLSERSGISPNIVEDYFGKVRNDPHHVRLGKIFSLGLRHGVPIVALNACITNIQGDHVASTIAAVRRFLNEILGDQADVTQLSGATCESCGSDQVVFSGGCVQCLSCGHGACS